MYVLVTLIMIIFFFNVVQMVKWRAFLSTNLILNHITTITEQLLYYIISN